MAKVVIFGVEGDDAVWLANLDAGTLTKVDPAAVDAAGAAESGFLSAALNARKNGYTLVKGVDLAVATSSRSEAAAHHMSSTPST